MRTSTTISTNNTPINRSNFGGRTLARLLWRANLAGQLGGLIFGPPKNTDGQKTEKKKNEKSPIFRNLDQENNFFNEIFVFIFFFNGIGELKKVATKYVASLSENQPQRLFKLIQDNLFSIKFLHYFYFFTPVIDCLE
ncbi:hypothetical protein BpHYR1_013880 [Brachionus plicatilis]|uniref:Uncharacterized protein n=1 Tax=Brachionus plicatilis TaxID=10195 RepID=A0A3M7PPN8_BRAPC|nr:hypothetical protein BpHYR1_013880 [Brachionus plicatilis]